MIGQILSPVNKSFKSSAMFVIICSNKVECPKQLTNDSRRFGDDDLQLQGHGMIDMDEDITLRSNLTVQSVHLSKNL